MKYDHEISMEKRKNVLSLSLTLEFIASLTLGFVLDIKDVENSRSLGNTSSSLSFAQKMNLLLDIETITRKEKSKLDVFMNVRNQFMHNKAAYSYFHAFKFNKGDLNRIQKIYPNLLEKEDISEVINGNDDLIAKIEISLEACVRKLYSDALDIITALKGGRAKKMISDVMIKRDKVIYDKLKEFISK